MPLRPEQRIVIRLPLEELWNSDGPMTLARRQEVGHQQIKDSLRRGMVRFVVANCGEPLKWISSEDCYRFWKEEVMLHLVDPESTQEGIDLDDFPDAYCYFGSEWGENETEPVIVLEMCH